MGESIAVTIEDYSEAKRGGDREKSRKIGRNKGFLREILKLGWLTVVNSVI
jgi:hypothetical protein